MNFTEHKAIRTGFHPYLDQEYGLWLRCQRDDQQVSGASAALCLDAAGRAVLLLRTAHAPGPRG
ncbi:MAG: hypothetical protein ACLU9S_15990 [Oscillospiraceae bacterium]